MIGTQRSGSNLFRLMLNQLPEIAAPHPPHVLIRMMPLVAGYGDLENPQTFAEFVDDACRLVESNPVEWDGVVLNRAEIVARCDRRDIYAVMAAIYDTLRDTWGKTSWCCKSLGNVKYSNELADRFPDAKFIYLYRDGRDVPHHLALGTYVVFEGETEYARRCFKEYAMLPDRSGKYAALYRPIHMIGLELGISVASAALRGEPTGAPTGFRSDVVATAKRPLKAGEMLDGEGGFCVWGKQTPAEESLARGFLPLGLAHNVKLKRDIPEGGALSWADVEVDANDTAVRVRREMEAAFGRPNA